MCATTRRPVISAGAVQGDRKGIREVELEGSKVLVFRAPWGKGAAACTRFAEVVGN
jgi:hypothetical protein